MFLKVSELPSRGVGSTVDQVEIKPLGLTQLIKYSAGERDTKLKRLRWDITNFIETIPDWEGISSYDIKPIIFMKKYLSVSQEDSIEVTVQGKVHKIAPGSLDFETLNPELEKVNRIKLNEGWFPVSIPTAKEFVKVLDQFIQYEISDDMKIVYICALLDFYQNPNQIKKVVSEAIREDIPLLLQLYTWFSGVFETFDVPTIGDEEGGVVSIQLDEFITDIFQCIWANQPLDPKKISIK